MRRGTTPTVSLLVTDCDMTDCTVYVSIKQCDQVGTLTNDDLEITVEDGNTYIVFGLTQEQTLSFAPGHVNIQVRWIDSDGTALASTIGEIDIGKILLEGEIAYE